MGKHYFHESSDKFGEYMRVIYCEWCGLVAWDFNKNENTEPTQMDLQAQVGNECNANPTPPKPIKSKGSKK